jgi:hypothetical protein
MGKTRNAWIQSPDFVTYEIGEIDREEIEKLWGSRWAQKCIRDVAEDVALSRFSPFPRDKKQEFRPPQLGFENGAATLTVSPWVDVNPVILYGVPLQEFGSWTVHLHIKRGLRLFGFIPMDYSFEMVVSLDDALEIVRLFYDYNPQELVSQAKMWREQINERYRNRGRFLESFFQLRNSTRLASLVQNL